MVELYWGRVDDFLDQARQNRIAETLRRSYFDQLGRQPGASEVRSWQNSLRAFADVCRQADFDDHGIILELQMPLNSKRLDAMITGTSRDGAAGAVIIELKQWDGGEASATEDCVIVFMNGARIPTLHPSAQVRQYRQHLADNHTSFHDARIRLSACSYLHNFLHDPSSELLDPRYDAVLRDYPLFSGDRIDELVSFLDDRVGGGAGMPVLRHIREGEARPHRQLLEHTAEMIRGEPVYTLLDEQLVVLKSILAKVAEVADSGEKAVFLVRGGPGTGKSVLALNLLAELAANDYSVHHATGSKAFTTTVKKRVGRRAAALFNYFNSYSDADEDQLDVLICDEAHRIREHSWNRFTRRSAVDPDRKQIDELLNVAKVSVFFLDDLQVVRRQEIGSSDTIREAARTRDIDTFEHELSIQFRCGGSDAYVRWVENTLGIRRTEAALWHGDAKFDFRVADTPKELDLLIRARLEEGFGARLVAGYAWPWSDPDGQGNLVDDVVIGDWSRPWNAKSRTGRLAPGIPRSELWASEPGGIDQVGCIYTAQGFEFDYVGVIFGPDLVHRPREGWVGRKEYSHDVGLKRGTDPATFTELVKNTYRVLLSRGLKGCYVHFMDEQTRNFVESRMDLSGGVVLAAEGLDA